MNKTAVWREVLINKHAGRAEHAKIILIITSLLITLLLVLSTLASLLTSLGLSTMLSFLSYPLVIWALIYLVFTYHASYVAWGRYNRKRRINNEAEISPAAFFFAKLPWLLLGRRYF